MHRSAPALTAHVYRHKYKQLLHIYSDRVPSTCPPTPHLSINPQVCLPVDDTVQTIVCAAHTEHGDDENAQTH
jgi:hypothetical protein